MTANALHAALAAPIVAPDLALVPLSLAHEPALAAAFADPELWTWMLVRAPRTPGDVRAWLDDALARAAAADHAAFVTVLPDGTLAGTTRFLDLRPHDRGVEIGWTMVFAHARGGWVNARAKRLMLERAFASGIERVQIKTDARNARSRGAIAALGAVYEGTLRSYQRRADGTLRDTALYAITAPEWPLVRERLDARAAARRPGAAGVASN